MKTITMTDIPHFKEAYDVALKEEKEVFLFKGSEVLTAYAKYVIEYFDIVLKQS